jgi:hypothetical protein
MITAIVLCPGPTLAHLTEPPAADIRLAVNTAIDSPAAAGTHWWVAHDLWRSENGLTVPPLPKRAPLCGVATCWAAIQQGQADCVPWRPLVCFQTGRFSRPIRVSSSAAVMWAAELIARTGQPGIIRVYGSEMAGGGHYDGGQDQPPDQDWNLARACMRQTVALVPYPVEGLPWL